MDKKEAERSKERREGKKCIVRNKKINNIPTTQSTTHAPSMQIKIWIFHFPLSIIMQWAPLGDLIFFCFHFINRPHIIITIKIII